MKIWIKLLVGCLLGSAIGIVMPAGSGSVDGILSALSGFVINFGRYALLPLFFFSIPIAVFELFEERKTLRVSVRSIAYSIASVCVAALLGTAAAVILKPARIPLITEAARIPLTPDVSDFFLGLFPQNGFAALFGSGDAVLPLIIACFALGLGFSFDKVMTKSVLTIFDTLSRVMWQINSFFVEILAVVMIPLTAAVVYKQRSAFAMPIYQSLLLTVAAETIFAAFVVIPLVLYFGAGRKNPFPKLYALLGPVVAGFASGNLLFPAGTLIKHEKESLGVRRRVGTVATPLAMVFGRAGTALVTATVFIVVLGSYSNIGLTLSSVVWVLLAVPPVMILLGAAPGAGPATAAMALCAMYGRGFESGYLLVVPVAVPIAACAVALDVLAAGVIGYLVARREGYVAEREIRHFI